jgi:ABC-type multidrug transport system, ATPase component
LTPAIQIASLAKRYGERSAVEGLDLVVPCGEFHALLGPNGAGKTTTLRIIAGILRPDAGSVRVMGHDIVHDAIAAKRAMAFIPDEPPLYGKLRPLEYLEFIAGLWSMDATLARLRAEALLEQLGLPTSGAITSTHSRAACARSWRSPARSSTSRR